ncbi:MAG TPA: malonate decarboxylase subunit epsilon [Chthoniobacterales bacterium]|nr:malonate decarboxylase subunit epsilon [Chthoniobacterales bacterium]
MSTAFLYPGQGAQVPGMLHQLPDHAVVSETLRAATQILNRDVLELDTEAALASTVAVQMALFICGVAVTRALRAKGIKPDLVVGLSVGAFAAAVGAGAVSFTDGLTLVKMRAELMEKAYPQGYGLAAIVGLSEARLAEIVSETNGPDSPVFIANRNSLTQIVIAGSDAAMQAVLDRVENEGARTAKRLPVSVPSHCPLMRSVADELTRQMARIEIQKPEAVYVSNRRARASRDPEGIREDLATNITHPVQWHDATTVAYERGVRLFIELPPGDALTELASAAFPEARCVAVGDTRIDSVINLAKREIAPMGQ